MIKNEDILELKRFSKPAATMHETYATTGFPPASCLRGDIIAIGILGDGSEYIAFNGTGLR